MFGKGSSVAGFLPGRPHGFLEKDPHESPEPISMGKRYRDFEIYLVRVDPERCNGCGECAKMCQGDVFEVSSKACAVRPENCLGCRACVALCQREAILVTEI